MNFKRVKIQKQKSQLELHSNEKSDIKLHIQRQQSKYGDIHNEFKYFLKQSEQQNYFSHQIKNYKQLLDQETFESNKKQERLRDLQKQLNQMRKLDNPTESIKTPLDEINQNMLTSQFNKQSSPKAQNFQNFHQETKDPVTKERALSQNQILHSQFSPKNTQTSIMDHIKFKKIDNGNSSFISTSSQSLLHSSQVQAFNMKNKISSVELNLEQLNEKILLEQQTSEYLSRMYDDTQKCVDKVKVDVHQVQDILKTYNSKEAKVDIQFKNFSLEQSELSKELKRAKNYVNKETQYQQNKIQEKVNLFSDQNKAIKESVKLVQNLRLDIKQQEKKKQKQIQKIEKLEDERSKKEITKKDSELFLKNLEEIDLILKHFINGNPDALNWDKFDYDTQNFEDLFFLAEIDTINESREDMLTPQIRSKRVTSQFMRQTSQSIDLSFERKSQTSIIGKFPSRDTLLKSPSKKTQFFFPVTDTILPKVQQNEIVEKINRFMRFHSLTTDQIYEKLIHSYHQSILTEVTLKNRLSNLMDEREDLLIDNKSTDNRLEELKQIAKQHKFLSKYEDIIFNSNDTSSDKINLKFEQETINEIIQKEEKSKIPEISKMFRQSTEKFISFMFYSLNELIFRWSSFITSMFSLSSDSYKEGSRIFYEQTKKKKDFSKKINNLMHQNQDFIQFADKNQNKRELIELFQRDQSGFDNIQNTNQKDINGQKKQENSNQVAQMNIYYILEQFQREILEQHKEIISDEEINVIHTYLRNDFVLINFIDETVLKNSLQKAFDVYKSKKGDYAINPFEQYSSYFLDNIYELKEVADKYFKCSLEFLIETLFQLIQDILNQEEFLIRIIENLKYEEQRNLQLKMQQSFSVQSELLVSFADPLTQSVQMNGLQTQIDTNNTTGPTTQKKQFRKRVIMMKCREFQDFFGFEVNRKLTQQSAAQTIVDVIYECLYDMRRGNQTEIFDVNQEITFFQKNRIQTKNMEKEQALKEKEELRKREEEQRHKEKSNKTYLLMPAQLEFYGKENKIIAQIEKTYNEKLKSDSTQFQSSQYLKSNKKQLSEKQKGEKRNEIIQKMRQTYQSFHTKYTPSQQINTSKDGETTPSNSNNDVPYYFKKRQQTFTEPKVQFSLTSTEQKNQKFSDINSLYGQKDGQFSRTNSLDMNIKFMTQEKTAKFQEKIEKKSIFKTSKDISSHNKLSPDESLNDFPLTERQIPLRKQKLSVQGEYNSEKKEIMFPPRKSSPFVFSVNSNKENLQEENKFHKINFLDEEIMKRQQENQKKQKEIAVQKDNSNDGENEKTNEENPKTIQLQSETQTPIIQVLQPKTKENVNEVIQTKENNQQKESIQQIPKLNALKIKKKSISLIKNFSDKLIKIPTPLGPIIKVPSQSKIQINCQSNDQIVKNQQQQPKKSPQRKWEAYTDRSTYLYLQKQLTQPSDYQNSSQRQAYLFSRSSKSSHFQSPILTGSTPRNLNYINYEL